MIERAVLVDTRIRVEEEIKVYTQRYGEDPEKSKIRYLDNFRCHFVTDYEGIINYRALEQPFWRTTYGDRIKASIAQGRVMADDQYSSLKKTKTPEQFYQDLDEASLNEGLDEDKRKVLEQKIAEEGSYESDIFDLTFPIYVRLRAMGYSKGDLTR